MNSKTLPDGRAWPPLEQVAQLLNRALKIYSSGWLSRSHYLNDIEEVGMVLMDFRRSAAIADIDRYGAACAALRDCFLKHFLVHGIDRDSQLMRDERRKYTFDFEQVSDNHCTIGLHKDSPDDIKKAFEKIKKMGGGR